MIKDAVGQDIRIGDICLYSSGKSRHLDPGMVQSITSRSIVFGGPFYVMPLKKADSAIVKLTSKQVFGLDKTWLAWLQRDHPEVYAKAASNLNMGI